MMSTILWVVLGEKDVLAKEFKHKIKPKIVREMMSKMELVDLGRLR